MGPITLFDKSFLQGISVDEAVWFDTFFTAVVCPVFYVETLADLAKEPSKRGPAEVIVKDIANKFPEMHGSPCSSHIHMAIGNLLGHPVPMDGRIPRVGGRPVKKGTVFEQTAEEEAFRRWQQGRFDDVEKIAATYWRKQLAELDLETMAKEFRTLGIDGKSCKSLEEAKEMAHALVTGSNNPFAQLHLAVTFLQIPQHFHQRIVQTWQQRGRRPLSNFAPYAAYVLSIEIFFQVALAAKKIATERPSNRTDIAYLFYLPFSSIFVSGDHLHRKASPLFMRSDQQFIWGHDLKPSLKAINDHFLTLTEAEKEKGIMRFADAPPPGNLVAEIWDARMHQGYREEPRVKMDPEEEKQLVEKLKAFREQPTIELDEGDVINENEMTSVARSVRRKRGSWYQVPKDMPDCNSSRKMRPISGGVRRRIINARREIEFARIPRSKNSGIVRLFLSY